MQVERAQVAAHYLCELADQALLQGEGVRAGTLVRQARMHQAQLPRADILAARIADAAQDSAEALQLYLHALEMSPGLALEIIPAVLAVARRMGNTDLLHELGRRLQASGRVSPPAGVAAGHGGTGGKWPACRGVSAEFGLTVESAAEASSLSALLTRIGDAGGRYQCDECGLNSVGWYWRCPKCRAWDSMRPAVFKWAERADHAARPP